MIFDNVNPTRSPDSSGVRRRRSSCEDRPESGAGRRRRPSTFEQASRLPGDTRIPNDRNTKSWFWVLGILIVAVLGLSWFLQEQKSSPRVVSGDAPSVILSPCIDPVLAPLVTGVSAYGSESFGELGARFRADRTKANRDDQEIYSTAATIADILREATEDRSRHLQRLQDLGSKERDVSKVPSLSKTERQHLELAIDVSWQRNSGGYRNRVEELWARLLRLEHGRFQSAPSAPPHS
jgi:hypothetical protein